MGNRHAKNTEVEEWLKQQKEKDQRQFRILLLGPGDSGKSTILKQMKKIEELLAPSENGTGDHIESVPLIREGILLYIHILCKSNYLLMQSDCDDSIKKDIEIDNGNTKLRDFFVDHKITRFETNGIDFDDNNDNNNEDSKNDTMNDNDDSNIDALYKIFDKLSQSHIKPLWADKGIKNTIKYRAMFADQIPDSAVYFLDKLDAICENNYNPSFEDYVRLRTKTSGAQIININIDLDKLDNNHKKPKYGTYQFEFTDIGGQASERNKWVKVMNNMVQVVLFVVAISEYDLPCYEDITKRRMQDALDAFRKLMTHNLGPKGPKFVQGKQIVVLFNKFDLLAKKLATVPLSSIEEFSDFGNDEKKQENIIDSAVDYFERKFVNVIYDIQQKEQKENDPKKPKLVFDCDKQLTFFNSQALNTQLIQQLFHKIMLHVVTGNLDKMGMGGDMGLM